MEIIPNVHLIPGIVANPYLILDSDGLTLIDAGLPGSHRKILKYIEDLGRHPADLKRILVTHSDIDHVGSLAALKKATGARVYASAIEAEAIKTGKPSRQIQYRRTLRRILMNIVGRMVKASPVGIDEVLSEGQTLPVLGGLKALETPGHTPGHLSFFSPSQGVLFAGDSMVSDAQGGLHSSRPELTWDQSKAADSTRRQANLKPGIVCPGHGPVVTEAAGKMPKL